jgi:U4/U6 small nuclear ribonucleoprotein PRP31
MASLHDELLNDFGDSGSEEEQEELQDETPAEVDADGDVAVAEEEAEHQELKETSDGRGATELMKKLSPILDQIKAYQSMPNQQQTKIIGTVEDHPEYKLLTQANALASSIDGEVVALNKVIRDHYSVRFPKLETLIANPLEYAKAVAIIGNEPMERISSSNPADNPVGQPLREVLGQQSFLAVTLEASNPRLEGQQLSEKELQIVTKACDMTLQLDKAKTILGDYVQSRMERFAPNLTALISSLTAAQLLNFAGGLTGLAKTPSCNIAPLGSKKSTQTGFASNFGVRHQGFLYNSPIIQEIPSAFKKQAMRIVSAKVVLAARVDSVHSSPDGSTGRELRQQCEERLEKLREPPPNKGVKALPAPDEKLSRKRGGRRARKAKEATAMTDLRKAQNRMAFGKEEAEVGYGTGDSTTGLGMIGANNDGRIRAQQIDQRTKAKLSKKNPGWGGSTPAGGTASSLRGFGQGAGNASVLRSHGLRTAGVGTSGGAGAGTASTIAFTPVQGLELVDPKVKQEMERKRKAEDDRWFQSGTFTMGSNTQPPKIDSGGFKVPQLPAKKKVDTGESK